MTRMRHLQAVRALEAEATSVVLGALGSVLDGIAATFGAVVAAAGETAEGGAAVPAGEAVASLDDLTRIQPEWAVRVDGTILPYYERVFEAGADGAVEQIAGMRDVAVEVITEGDPLLLNQAKTQHLAVARDRFLNVGVDTWEAARAELLEGFSAGEGIDPLRRRIENVATVGRVRAEAVARTEVISTSNAGATARVDAMGADAPPYKQWISTNDGRTRPTHRAADNQVVARGETFSVGGEGLQFPGDPAGTAAEVVNCRCTLAFTDSDEPEVLPADLLAEIEAEMAASPSAPTADTRDRADAGQAKADALINRHSRRAADRNEALTRLVRWRTNHAVGVTSYAAVQLGPQQVDTTTGELHTGSMIALLPSAADAERLAIDGGEPPEQLHVTLRYLGEAADIPPELQAALLAETESRAATLPPLQLDPGVFGAALWNPDTEPSLNYSIGGADLAAARDEFNQGVINAPDNVDGQRPDWSPPANHEPWVAHMCAAYGGDPATLLPQMVERVGPVTLDRVRLTFGGVNVNDIALGEPVVAAATPPGGDMPYMVRPGGADCPFEVVKSDSGERMGCHATEPEADAQVAALYAAEGDDAAAALPPSADLEPQPGEHFHAIMHTQGVSTGLRTFLNLSWRTPPFAFHWMHGSAAHGGTPATMQVGLVTRVVADPAMPERLHAFGPLDLGSAGGAEYARQLIGGFARSVSIGLDEQPFTRTMVWPEGVDTSDPMAMMDVQPEQIIIDGGRIGELTGVSVPAQDDASIEPTTELLAMFGDIGPGNTEPVLSAPVLSARTFVDGRGALTAASLMAAPERPDYAPAIAALAASAYRIEVREAPPADWYKEPTDVELASALMVTDHGRLYGVLAPLGLNHRAWAKAGTRREVPFGNVDYSRFMGAWGITSAGLVPAGPLTMDTGHAPIYRTDGAQAPAHYDNSASVVGAIAVGENRERRVVWIAGALVPGVSVEQVARMLACRCSGDWQPHAERAGWTELIATLLVPSPGFAMEHQGAASTSYNDRDVLVASSVPVRQQHRRGGRLTSAAQAIASSIGVGPRERLADALAAVDPEQAS